MRIASLLAASWAAVTTLAAQAQPGPTDPQIAHIVVTANQVDIEAGKLAENRGSTAEVKAFGKQMVTDHTAVNQQAAALAKKLGVTPEANPTSASLQKGGDDNIAQLRKLKGKDFDKASRWSSNEPRTAYGARYRLVRGTDAASQPAAVPRAPAGCAGRPGATTSCRSSPTT